MSYFLETQNGRDVKKAIIIIIIIIIIIYYMGNARLLLAPMFLLLPIIRDICDPPSQYFVNPRDPWVEIKSIKTCRVSSRVVAVAMLVSLNKGTAAMLVPPTSHPLGIEPYSYADVFACFGWKTCSLITWVKTPHTKIIDTAINNLSSHICSHEINR